MEIDTKKDDKTSPDKTRKNTDKDEKIKSKKPAAETDRTRLIDSCISALGLCLSRFPQHYKSLYRLAQVHCFFDSHKVSRYGE